MVREPKTSRLRERKVGGRLGRDETGGAEQDSVRSILSGAVGVGLVAAAAAWLLPGIGGGGNEDPYSGAAPLFTAKAGASACLDLDALIRLEMARTGSGSGARIEGCTELVPGQRVRALEARDPYLCVLPEGRRNCLWVAEASLKASE